MAEPRLLQAVGRPLRFIITGAGRGLGRGLARLLYQAGHDVFLLDANVTELQHTLDHHLPQSAKSATSTAPAGRFDGASCDVEDRNSIITALRKARTFHRNGQIDVLINNAARTGPYWESIGSLVDTVKQGDPLAKQAEDKGDAVAEEWNHYLATNLSGAFHMTRLCLGMLKDDDGKGTREGIMPTVIFISSTRAKQSEPNHEAYASTKAGLLGLTHALASSLHPLGIRSNAILPGWIPSGHESVEGDQASTRWDADLTDADQEQHWSGRVGRIEDLYNAVLFLATTRFANGEEVVLDGGMTRKMQYVE